MLRKAKQQTLLGGDRRLKGFYRNGSSNNKLKAAMAGVKAGTRRMTVLLEGPSTVTGQGAGTGTNGLVDARVTGPGVRMAARFTADGYPAQDQSRFGNGNVVAGGVTLAQYDPRVDIPTTTWSMVTGGFGNLFNNSASGVEPWKITPTVNRDTDVLIYYQNGSAGIITCTVGGAAPLTGGSINMAGSNAMIKTSITTAVASMDQLSITPPASVNNFLAGTYSYDSSVKGVDVCTYGSCGATSGLLTAGSNAYRANETVKALAPDLTIIVDVSLNDQNNNAAPSAVYNAAMQSAIDAAKLSGDVLIVVPFPPGGNFRQRATEYGQAAMALGAANNVAVFNEWEYFAGLFTAGNFFDANVHPTAAFYDTLSVLQYQAIKLMAS